MLNTEVANGILVGTVLGTAIGVQWVRVWQPALRRKVAETRRSVLQALIRALEEEGAASGPVMGKGSPKDATNV